jgi:hypothetical protein
LELVVSEEGISTYPDKVKAVQDWPRPKTTKQMRGFLGLCSYYRKYVKHFADHCISCVTKAQDFSGMMNVNRLLLG